MHTLSLHDALPILLKSGEIEKKETHPGFFFYHTPERFKEANKHSYIHARMYENRHFVFFQWVESPNFGPGLTEGFLYTSTGEPPKTIREFDYIGGLEFTPMEGEENWYFVTDGSDYYD